MTVPGIIAHQSSLKGGEQMKIPHFDESAGCQLRGPHPSPILRWREEWGTLRGVVG